MNRLFVVLFCLLFIASNGRSMTSYQEGSQSVTVELSDGSALVLDKQRGEDSGKAFRVSRQGSKQHLTAAPKFNYGIAAVKLADGRVLMTGGYTSKNQAWLYDPRRDTWEATGTMSVGRMYMALAALPDGRAFVAGSSWIGTASDSSGVRLGLVYGAELWDPRSGLWTALPSLPLSFKITAHRATGPSAAVLPDGSLVIGGGMHKHVLLLRARGKTFAPYWTVVGSTPGHRISGIVQARGNNEVFVSGGFGPTASGQCCQGYADQVRISWVGNGEERAHSLSLGRADAAVAHRGELSFAAGGWESFYFFTVATQASAVAELIDHRNNRVKTLPPLPHPVLTGRALWIDDDRVIVKAVAHMYGESFQGMQGGSLEAESSGFLAIYSLRQNSWNSMEDPRFARAELAGAINNEAILVSPDARVWAVTLGNLSVRELPRLVHARNGGFSRVVSDGRIVVAGGQAQADTVQAIDADCDRPNCPAVPFGYGALQPSRRHEIFSPDTGSWQLSAQSQGAGESAVVRADGRVVTLGAISPTSRPSQEASGYQRNRWLIEESNGRGTNWRTLPLPTGVNDIETQDGTSCGRDNSDRKCMLLLGEHPSIAGDAIFLLRGRWDYKLPGQRHDLWIFTDDTKQWTSIARDMTREQLHADRILLRRVGGGALYGSVFQPHKVRLWVE